MAKVLNIAGYKSCGAYQKAKTALNGLSAIFPTRFTVNVEEHETRDTYMSWLDTFKVTVQAPEHKTSPIIWFPNEGNKYLLGRDDTLAWCRSILSATEVPTATPDTLQNVDPWNAEHGFEYDLVVIGGGSGGLACSKEAQKLGAKVAVLDFVKPSPLGSKWGLGGTCVNVGCIPKKLMHQSALLGEAAKDAKGYGWMGLENGKHDWETMRSNVQDHIKGINFSYRVQLREAGVTYLNRLGKFTGPNSMELTDAKGKVSQITAARFVIATGGRPAPLACPGGELAMSSDDIFMKETAPGKTCVVGAGYVALECAGFLTGLDQGEVTVLVRSAPLRAFDKDTVNYVQDYMMKKGTQIVTGVTPQSIQKLPSGKLLVCYGDTCGEFDTVLAAIGRMPDLTGLNLSALGMPVTLNEKTGKVVCTNEQTSVPHVYAIGDVVDGAPELTPAAILAGKLLARRLFPAAATTGAAAAGAEAVEYMDYKSVATAVFTPLELGTVGLTEAEAKEKYGEASVESYITSFSPLEWSLTENHADVSCFCKIVVNKDEKNKVLGMHIASPNAGEVIQGFALAFKAGLTLADVTSCVGIHPTIAEEFTTLSITKSSGQSVAKTSC
mmetsp:Transcript_7691/g.12776  ORF Transcript_7691/g.12776 Transcript_7691/m.12776 type:complete len:610 (+) Transcript_7691:75-1904(+)